MGDFEFEITVQRKYADSWPVVVNLKQPGGLTTQTEGILQLSFKNFEDLLAAELDAKTYGKLLGEALFNGKVDSFFKRARGKAPDCLRMLLSIEVDSNDPLKTLHWESLCAPIEDDIWSHLALCQSLPFSLYIPSSVDRLFPPISKGDLRALVLVASPTDKKYSNLAPFDIGQTVKSVVKALGNEIPCDVLANVDSANRKGPPTLSTMCRQLSDQPYTLLHVVCHGRLLKDKEGLGGDTALYFETENNEVETVTATKLIDQFRGIGGKKGLPRFTFLSSCETADPRAEAGALGGLGQRLVRDLGMPAVVAMTRRVSIDTALALGERFYERLRESGHVDEALQQATAPLQDRADITVPALFSRLGGRPLFTDGLELGRELSPSQVDSGIKELRKLIGERAPNAATLKESFEQQAKILETVRSNETEDGHDKRKQAIKEIDVLCHQLLDIGFDGLAALGKQPEPFVAECPFPGLSAFRDERYHKFFFGRDGLVEALTEKLRESSFLAVSGSSGSGKSSLVLAGLIPNLRKDQPDLQLAYMTPGNEPSARLREIMQGKISDGPFILVVDQFEELFTLCNDKEKRRKFVDEIVRAVPGRKVILTMRADFVDECILYPELTKRLDTERFSVRPMQRAELGTAMESQAKKARLEFEAGLSNVILKDVEEEPGAMPLLQYALRELWNRRWGRRLVLSEYERIGGIQKALSKTADAFLDTLSEAEREQVKNIFVRLIRLDDQAVDNAEQRDTRCRVRLQDLTSRDGDREQSKRLVGRLAGEGIRLVVTSRDERTGQEEVEIAHEALIRHWGTLQGWLKADRADLLQRQTIERAEKEWHEHRKEDDNLLRGGRLELAEGLLKRRPDFLTAEQADFVNAGIDFRKRQRERDLRERRRLRVAAAGFAVLFVLAVGAGAWAYFQKQEALKQTAKSEQQRQILSARSLLGRNDEQALLLSIQGERDLPSPEMEDLLRTLLWQRGQVVRILEPASEHPALSATWDPRSGGRVATVIQDGKNGIAKVWNTQTDKECKLLTWPDKLVDHAVWDPKGTRILTVSWDVVEIWDPVGCTRIRGWMAHTWDIKHAAWNSNGTQILTVGSGADSTVKVWDAENADTRNPIVEFDDHKNNAEQTKGDGTVRYAAWSHDDTHIVMASDDGTARVWNPKTKKAVVLKGPTKGVIHAAWSMDDKRIVTASSDGSARIWNAERGDLLLELPGHTKELNDAQWSPDSTRILTASNDGTARVWDLQNKESTVLIGHAQEVLSAVWKKDGKRIITTGKDGTVRVWDASNGKETARLAGHNGQVNHVEWSPDFSQVITAGNDGAILVWDPEEPPMMPVLDHSKEAVREAIWSPDNTRILTISGKTVRLWDPETRKQVSTLPHPKDVVAAVWSGNGERIASASWDGFVRVWNINGTKWERKLFEPEKDSVFRIAWRPDGLSVVGGGYDGHEGTVMVWNAADGQKLQYFSVGKGVVPWAWNSTGTRLVTKIWTVGEAAQVWDVNSGTKIWDLGGHGDGVWDAAWSPDDKRIVTASNDKISRIFEADTGQELATLIGSDTGVTHVSWNLGGTQIMSIGNNDSVARVWDAASGNELFKLPHSAAIRDAEWSTDQKFIATFDDNSVGFWNNKGQKIRDPINQLRSKMTSIHWDAAGKKILTASDDGTAKVFLLDREDLLKMACRRATRNMTPEEWKTFVGSRPYRETCVRDNLHAGAVAEAPSAQPTGAAEPNPSSPDGSPTELAACSSCPQMVEVPVGRFMMGSLATDDAQGDEKPQHTVTIAKPFAVSRFEITFDEWDACVADGGCNDYRPDDEGWGRNGHPVVNVSWKEAQAYPRWLSAKTGKNYRLLTEAEWEYAARAGSTSGYSWGDDIGAANANCKTCGSQWDGRGTAPAGSFNPNPFGLLDMNGNVWEWVQDCWHADYRGAPADGSSWEAGSQCSQRVLRGGSWNNSAAAIRSAQRSGGAPDARADNVGFRVARDH